MTLFNEQKLGFTISRGFPQYFGATLMEAGINFSIYIKDAYQVILCLYDQSDSSKPIAEIELSPSINQTGDTWHIHIKGLKAPIRYVYRFCTQTNKELTLQILDPFAKALSSHLTWQCQSTLSYNPLGWVTSSQAFDWQVDLPLNIPKEKLIIYEMHARGFTIDPSSGVEKPGTFLGIIEKIPYLKNLGINAIELLPVHEFNEMETHLKNPLTKQPLCNYFGYSSVSFFSLMNRYATEANPDAAINEFKLLVRELHKNGIEIILDVVFNHTAEGNEKGPIFSYSGLDNSAYYITDADGNYLNYSGCGNTFNCNHSVVIELILTSLRYFVTEMHVDGFRFDLASIFWRAENGEPLHRSPLVDAIARDPILTKTKLIAEAWDAAGFYQVGGFYPGNRFSEWNDRYRDSVRKFIKGTPSSKTSFATAISGSQDIFGWGRAPSSSINYITAHDGFSLKDLVSYNHKHNIENGENNQDGSNHNESWNCGFEGFTNDEKINNLRQKQMRNLVLSLLISQGIPMVLMGDEYGHTRRGNNNPWCQDNGLNWFLWSEIDNNQGFYRFFKALIHFRKNHTIFQREDFLTENDVSWHGLKPFHPNWNSDDHFIAFTLHIPGSNTFLYAAFNCGQQAQTLILPDLPDGKQWLWVVDTHKLSPQDYHEEGSRPFVETQMQRIQGYSAILLESPCSQSMIKAT